MTARVTAYLSAGSNVGDRLETLEAALFALDDTDGIVVVDVSSIYQTEPWGGVEQEPFYNIAIEIETTLEPHDLLRELQLTEAAFGRSRPDEQRWGPRTLDLDVLLYGEAQIESPDLVVPHPRMHERAFVLVPLFEIMPGGALPDGRRLSELLTRLAPIEGVEMVMRLADVPGSGGHERPEGPGGPGAMSAEEYARIRPTPPSERA